MREILVNTTKEGQFKIEIPDDAKISYGYFNPASPREGFINSRGYDGNQDMRRACLRIYGKTKDEALAAFNDVTSWRDLSLKVTRLVAKVKGEEEYWQDDDGNMESKVKRAVELQQLPDRI